MQGKKVPKNGKICTIFDLIITFFKKVQTNYKNRLILAT